MTSIQLFWLILGTGWAMVELVIAAKTRVKFPTTTQLEYRSERLIWLVVAFALLISLSVKQMHWVTLPIETMSRQMIAIPFFIIGLAVRCYAVYSLGQFFSTSVATKDKHLLIENGPYQFIRHPAYTGLLISFFAAGLAMGDGLALLALFCPIAYVLAKRIRFEEQCLSEHFGKPYGDYCLHTWKLIPWLY
ncbi:isoprenylcysteine carboxyl methyltransferase [Methyloglobulus morosus KoM1]|uniref:Isoprenylcysteine carboxyl methyltransferase n=1 Tax=Methyloglobulus morosus KoM1 TaxID=1116472 RepID=V5C7U0_9GAMM|nr:isoprenylcysteine carboxylmethyltransferase family protein [Methyloglobulus morosus]ESS72798.1 isoprenylcysteine carboxyl methyltransferase [Methyloglobulus morosus KoM1]